MTDQKQPVAADRQRLAEAVAKMAIAIETGACDPTISELKAVARTEVARLRRRLGALDSAAMPGGRRPVLREAARAAAARQRRRVLKPARQEGLRNHRVA